MIVSVPDGEGAVAGEVSSDVVELPLSHLLSWKVLAVRPVDAHDIGLVVQLGHAADAGNPDLVAGDQAVSGGGEDARVRLCYAGDVLLAPVCQAAAVIVFGPAIAPRTEFA